MSEYPQLAEMGINNPEEIEKYMVNGISTYDVLRIVYEREKGSLLPTSRTYKFLRIQREIPASDAKGKTTTVLETHPDLRKALSELDVLCKQKMQKQDTKKVLLEQIRLLEEDMALRSKYIKELAEKL